MGPRTKRSGDRPKKPNNPIDWYNLGVSRWQQQKYGAASKAFANCLETKSIRDQAAYAIALCQNIRGKSVAVPKEFLDRADEVAAIFMAGNLVCTLIQEGHSAKLTRRGSVSEARASISGSEYLFQISEIFGTFNMFAWRLEGDRQIPVSDTGHNPNPTETDRKVISWLEMLPDLPLAPIPENGLPADTRVHVGSCPQCGKALKVKADALKPVMNITCKCGWHGDIDTGRGEILVVQSERGTAIEEAQTTAWDLPAVDETPNLIRACQFGNYAEAKRLLESGANVNVQGSLGVCPLYAAALDGHLDVVELLLQYDPDLMLQDHQGWTPLFAAAENGNGQIMDALLARHDFKSVNQRARNGATALIIAAQNGRLEAVKKLVDHKAAIDMQNEVGVSPLFISCANGYSAATKYLLEKGADFETRTQDNVRHTPLTIAAQGGHTECVALLLNHGADRNARTKPGETALALARKNSHMETAQLLQYSQR